ncbi:helicase-associated domain-containing protein [Mycetocola sp. JXN-3]|uniref:helicase-associated domain-containing protein n=1 Tax=Mycetocola sp. JXN-3 TaxID=2116510 RepID=UPI00165D078B|nr:helicase-associated domain-containing protein [Mycetocola sp. JXN-3]
MQPRVADLRLLAGALSARTETDLDVLLRLRRVPPAAKLTDFFDLAELLLAEDSLRAALSPLDRERIRALAHAEPTELSAALTTELSERALLVVQDQTPVFLDTVTRLASSISTASATFPAEPATAHPAPAGRLARGERALSELVIGLGDTPARELLRGGLAQPELRRLGTELGLDPEIIPALMSLAADAQLVTLTRDGWVPTDTGEAWLGLDTPTRWRVLAEAWAAGFPAGIASLAVLNAPFATLLDAGFPAATDPLRLTFAQRLTSGEILGVLSHGRLTIPGVRVLTTPEDLAEALVDAFPAPITGVYLQHDLSIIIPGTLAPHLERTLRGFADLENRAEASTYRLSDASIIRGLSAGTTAEEISTFLEQISLTGVPQPVRYLIARGGERFGSLILRPDSGQSRLTVTESPLLDQMLVDRNLSALALHRDSAVTAHSRFDPDVVFWALTDARYPVVAHTIEGSVRRPRRRVAPVAVIAETDYRPLIDVLTSAARDTPTETDAAWLTRRLATALRARETLNIAVHMPGHGDFTFLLEPTGISGGRLRGLDKAADTERTFPIANITTVSEV